MKATLRSTLAVLLISSTLSTDASVVIASWGLNGDIELNEHRIDLANDDFAQTGVSANLLSYGLYSPEDGPGSYLVAFDNPDLPTAGSGYQNPATLILTVGNAGGLADFVITYDGRPSLDGGVESQRWLYRVNPEDPNIVTGGWTEVAGWNSTYVPGSGSFASEIVQIPGSVQGNTVQFMTEFVLLNPASDEANGIVGDSLDFDNIQITAVPEPVNVALAMFGLSAVAVGVGRRLHLKKRV